MRNRRVLSRIRRGERVDHYETVRRRKDGSLIDISLTVSPLKDANLQGDRRLQDCQGHHREQGGTGAARSCL